jgi:hypothetical protein
MKWTNILALMVAQFGSGKTSVKVDEATNSPTFTAEQADKMDEALAQLATLQTENGTLSADLATAQSTINTLNETIVALEAEVAELGKAPGKTGAESNDPPVETGNTFGPNHPLWTSADAIAAANKKNWEN